MFIFTFLVPGAAPSNVRADFINSTSILVEWDDVPEDKQHGRIQSYTVIWKRVQEELPEEITVPSPYVRKYVLGNLKKYTEYSIQVLAATRIGKGPASVPIVQRTDEDGK